MYGVLLAFHIVVSLSLIGIVLVQSGKGGGLAGGAFGGGAQTVFGGRGANDVVTRATIVLGGLFFATSLVLALMTSGVGRAPKSLIQEQAKQSTTAPVPGQAPSALPEQTPAETPAAPGQGSGGPGGP